MDRPLNYGGASVLQQIVALSDSAGNIIDPPNASGSNATTFCDQAVIAVTGTAVALPSHALKNGCIVKSLSTNSALRQTTSTSATLGILVAGASGAAAGYILEPGEAAPYAAASNLTNANQIFVNGQAGDVFSIIGS